MFPVSVRFPRRPTTLVRVNDVEGRDCEDLGVVHRSLQIGSLVAEINGVSC